MKKIIIILLFTGVITFAQNNIVLGVKSGINYSTLVGKDVNKYGSVDYFFSFHGGFFINFKLNNKISLQSEILGTVHGAKLNYNYNLLNQNIDISSKSYLPYIAFPVMLKYYPIESLSFELGPQIGILFQENFVIKIAGEEITGSIPESIKKRLKDLRKVDFGVNLGVSYHLNNKIAVYTRLYKGFLSMDSRKENKRNLKNQVFMLGVEYSF